LREEDSGELGHWGLMVDGVVNLLVVGAEAFGVHEEEQGAGFVEAERHIDLLRSGRDWRWLQGSYGNGNGKGILYGSLVSSRSGLDLGRYLRLRSRWNPKGLRSCWDEHFDSPWDSKSQLKHVAVLLQDSIQHPYQHASRRHL